MYNHGYKDKFYSRPSKAMKIDNESGCLNFSVENLYHFGYLTNLEYSKITNLFLNNITERLVRRRIKYSDPYYD